MTSRTSRKRAFQRTSRKKRVRRGFRQEILDLHQAIFRQNQTRINRSVFGYSQTFKKYEQEYAKGVKTYQCRVSFNELERALKKANFLYVGDYHTLVQSQRNFLRLLKRLSPDRSVVLGLEFIQGRFQQLVDKYMADKISEQTFLNGIQFHKNWEFASWSNIKDILDLARDREYRVIGIDTAGHGAAGTTLMSRDRYAANKIVKTFLADTNRLVLVLVGQLHIAPEHLPLQVEKELGQNGKKVQQLILYQNCQNIYWQLEARGHEHDVELVRIARNKYCWINTPPIVCQQSFLNWLDVDDVIPQLEAPEENFKEYVEILASFFDLGVGEALDTIEVTTVIDLSFLSRLRRRGDFSSSDMAEIKKQILSSESYFIPRANMVYLGNLSVNHAAEEATHFLRYECSSQKEPKLLVDAFYVRCIEEALGFLGSKLINHKRKRPRLSFFKRQAYNVRSNQKSRKLARLVLKHVSFERGKRVRKMSTIYECDVDTFNALTHVLGYRLGERMYYGLVNGVLIKEEIRDLFFDKFEEEGAPLSTYLYFILLTADIHVPDHI